MEPIPLPSYIHYELLLQLLERQTSFAANSQPAVREQVQQLIATLRKALAQQKQLEASCERAKLPIEYRWSLNDIRVESENWTDSASAREKPEINH
ncbi:DUF5340 domain-containing protein [Limnofasciculus baicalensis]|uniref:DUF5340 domain-containing protein n=1 Tax=Limnofasciculus baicalensis BBK-W-15 TaxID=2699891 RepID=A0AAE3GTB6_9CYAN|nr:DUF5340 domain-containing protein [Limnofasciculus baicalensis]MCP2730286.1 DUF5340 domain-containing protein [Limnofasciculus baicalensis BBK-W-15]